MRLPFFVAATAIALSPAAARADGVDWALAACPKKADGKVDTTARVDKNLLATVILDYAKVPRRLEMQLTGYRDSYRQLSVWQALIARNVALCDDHLLSCAKGDDVQLALASTYLSFILTMDAFDVHVRSDAERQPLAFLTDDSAYLTCKAPASETAATPPGPTTAPAPENPVAGTYSEAKLDRWSPDNFRVRGGPDDLIYERESSGFSDAGKGTVSYGDDGGKSTFKLIVALGYAFPLFSRTNNDTGNSGSANLIPYVATNLNWSSKAGQARDVTSNTVDFGAVFELRQTWLHKVMGDTRNVEDFRVVHSEHYLSAAPHLLTNYDDHSQIAGLTFLFRPSFTLGGASSGSAPVGFNRLLPIGKSGLWWNGILEGRFDNGVFTRTGTRDGDHSRNFSRLGARFGLGVTSDIPGFPAELTVTDTWMQALTGYPNHLSQLKADFTFYFTDKKYVGLTVGYARGRVADLDDADDKWSAGLAIKY